MPLRFKDDFGMLLSIPTEGMDLDAAITIELRVRKPDDSIVVWTATNTDENAEYTFVEGDLNQSGVYVGTVYATYAGPQERFSSPWYLQVGEHI